MFRLRPALARERCFFECRRPVVGFSYRNRIRIAHDWATTSPRVAFERSTSESGIDIVQTRR